MENHIIILWDHCNNTSLFVPMSEWQYVYYWSNSKSEDRSCSVVWWFGSGCFCIFFWMTEQTVAGVVVVFECPLASVQTFHSAATLGRWVEVMFCAGLMTCCRALMSRFIHKHLCWIQIHVQSIYCHCQCFEEGTHCFIYHFHIMTNFMTGKLVMESQSNSCKASGQSCSFHELKMLSD